MNRNFFLFLILNTIAFLGFQILVPLVPVYALEFSATESQIGILAGVIALAAMIIRPVTGPAICGLPFRRCWLCRFPSSSKGKKKV